MNGRVIIAFIAGLLIGAAGGILGYTFFVGGDGAPSTDIADAGQTLTLEEEAEPAATEAPAEEESATEEPEMATAEEPAADADTDAAEADGLSGRALYRIQQEPSEVSFSLDEDLRGQRVTVVGTTDQVAADIIVDFDNPAQSEIGAVTINARTLETDNSFRNRALRSNILLSSQDQYEFITFTPTALNGLPENIAVGETYSVQIVGDLEIIGRSNEVTFEAELTLRDEATLVGTATTTVLYADWEITIPNAPGVANITDEVILTINFEATQVEAQ